MTDQVSLSRAAVIVQGEGQVSTVVDGKVVLMSIDNGKYYHMDEIGSRIWGMIETPTAVGALCDQLLQEFEVEPATCEADVVALLSRLVEEDLIRVVSSGS